MQSVAERIGKQSPRLEHLPARAVTSAGDDAIAWAESIGWRPKAGRGYYVLDEWQKFCIRGLLSEDASALLCVMVALIIVARQNGKNVILEVVELYAFFVLDLPYILHTAHLQETTADHMDNMWSAIQSDRDLAAISRRVVANGKEMIYRVDRVDDDAGLDDDPDECKNHRIKFRTRSEKVGRGPSPRMVVFDEALHLLSKQVRAVLPSMSAQSMRPDQPILIYTSSAPYPTSEVLHKVRSSILDGRNPDAFLAEWSVELEVAEGEELHEAMARLADDDDALYDTNPAMGVRISPDWVRANERDAMETEDYLIERLSVVFEGVSAKLAIPNWSSLGDGPDAESGYEGSTIATDRQWALAVSPVEHGPQWASIGVAGLTAEQKVQVEWMHHRKGTAWVVQTVVDIQKRKPIPIRVHSSGPEAALIGPLLRAGALVDEVPSADVERATGRLIAAADERNLVHLDQPSLTKSVSGAVLRTGVNGAAIWSQRNSKVEITPLMACTVALSGVAVPDEQPAAHVAMVLGG
jgi:phage terminase large subunit-like protein